MSAAPDSAPSRPRLAPGSRMRWDEARQSWVVLAPERVILLDETARRPRLAPGSRMRYDEARQSWVVLAPERVIMLDEIAYEIVRRCDGTSTIAEITADLAKTFEAEPGEVAADVDRLIADLLAKRIMAP